MSPELAPGIFFSDSVIREEGTGKLSLIGGFQFFNANSFPFLGPPFAVTFGLRNLSENQQFDIKVEVISPNNVQLADVRGQVRLQKVEAPEASFEFPIAIPPLPFPQAGTYMIAVSVNGMQVGRRPLIVRSITSLNITP
jgi:hypothetical protein